VIDEQELQPKSNLGLINKDTLSSLDEWAIGPSLRLEPDILAQDKWQEMLGVTQKDGLERGLTVTFDGKKLIAGKVFQGTKDSITPDFFPRGIRSVFSRREKNLVSLHTHPMPPELNHVQTVPVSDKDINLFINSSFKAMVAIDRGGVHMLARNPYSSISDQEEKPAYKIVEESLKTAKEKENTAISVMKEIAKKLKPLGIEYYYSPNLIPSDDGFVVLTQV
jgi:hypothetical protein